VKIFGNVHTTSVRSITEGVDYKNTTLMKNRERVEN
jgi:hypothetical protein